MDKTITAELAGQLYEADNGDTIQGWGRVAEQHVRTSRWMEHYHLVLVDHRDGDPWCFWGLGYAIGLTENQDSDLPWQSIWKDVAADAELPLVRLYSHEVHTVAYRTTPPEAITPS